MSTSSIASAGAATRRNLILSGGVGHDFAATSAMLEESLAPLGVESAIVDTMADACTWLESKDVHLFTVNCLRWRMLADRFADQRAAEAWTTTPRFRTAVTDHLARGGGLLALHTAVICFDDWPEWRTIIGAAWDWQRSWHPPLAPVAARARGEHPIVRGVQDFVVEDEVYCDLSFEADVEPLLESTVEGTTYPLLWARSFGGGRVVCNLLGHSVASSAAPIHTATNRRSGLWAMGADERCIASAGATVVDAGPFERSADPLSDCGQLAQGKERVMSETITLTSYGDCLDAYRNPHLKQALYDEGDVIMDSVLVNLHGDAHRARRRCENRLFRRDTFRHYEHELFPGIIERTMQPHEVEGRADLSRLGHHLLLNLSAPIAGVDRPTETPDETQRLYQCLMKFIEGATMAHSTRDKDVVRGEVLAKLDAFDREFFAPSLQRRRALCAEVEAGKLEESELPRDILTLLLRGRDQLAMDDEVLRREIAFYLLAGAHTSSTAFTRTLDAIFGWLDKHPQDAELVKSDRLFVQRCVYETVRLNPSSPIGMRWALEDVTLRNGVTAKRGDRVVFDLVSANRDESIFGDTAADFDPNRPLPEGVARYGLSFGAGMHACIGRELAAGVTYRDSADRSEHLFGLVSVAVQALIERGARPDPERPPVVDAATKRPYWSSYPVLLG